MRGVESGAASEPGAAAAEARTAADTEVSPLLGAAAAAASEFAGGALRATVGVRAACVAVAGPVASLGTAGFTSTVRSPMVRYGPSASTEAAVAGSAKVTKPNPRDRLVVGSRITMVARIRPYGAKMSSRSPAGATL